MKQLFIKLNLMSIFGISNLYHVFAYDTVLVKPSNDIKSIISKKAVEAINNKLISENFSKSKTEDVNIDGLACHSHSEFQHLLYYCTTVFSSGGGTLGAVSLKYNIVEDNLIILDWTVD